MVLFGTIELQEIFQCIWSLY